MSEVIVFPDAEETFRAHLVEQLPLYGSAASAHCAIPTPRPDLFVTVQRTGGPRRDLVTDSAQLTFDCWALTPSAAHDLAQLTRGIVNATPGSTVQGVPVYTAREMGGPVQLPDPKSKQARYTFTTSIAVRGSARERED